MYQTLVASGANQALDPINPSGATSYLWDNNSSLNLKTESAVSLHYRDDYEMMTTNVYYGIPGGLKYVPGTHHTFGNNGTTAYFGSVNSGSNTSLNTNLTVVNTNLNAANLYLDLTDASDHLPVVADYTIPILSPLISSIGLDGTNLVLNVANSITGGVFTVLMSTNISLPLTNWIALATNTAISGNFMLTATNAVNLAAPNSFFILQEK
jgi:hypothetical protein